MQPLLCRSRPNPTANQSLGQPCRTLHLPPPHSPNPPTRGRPPVRAIEDCIGIGSSAGRAPIIPKRCQDRAALLEACIGAPPLSTTAPLPAPATPFGTGTRCCCRLLQPGAAFCLRGVALLRHRRAAPSMRRLLTAGRQLRSHQPGSCLLGGHLPCKGSPAPFAAPAFARSPESKTIIAEAKTSRCQGPQPIPPPDAEGSAGAGTGAGAGGERKRGRPRKQQPAEAAEGAAEAQQAGEEA
jgi:hypothetical protein